MSHNTNQKPRLSGGTLSRRKLITTLAGGAIAYPFMTRSAHADQALTEEDPMALALGYKINAAEVDPAKHSNYSPDQCCANCLQYKSNDESSGGCAIFPGKTVAAKGWCKVWAKK